ncbi:dTDP-4-dehydrorhamnose reductase [Rhizobium sp. CFBP 8762]|uniref:dTDP-4-dehydrorhamnose reductase n=1 Tax=Rhizobium sp. CFBP 8762 TaxID=2775279 RepID=UPI0017826AFA|nr:dTDP-4-dehydrorhamnose reductase [Rhizobium sp. CFBP 8762]MBD8555132.1 dTDP-4-dehydrorhamnose reductase [Rhizobium sp. CFBP 8762]
MISKLRYLVTGLEGQVVRSLIEQCSRPEYNLIELIPVGRPVLDLEQLDTIKSTVDDIKPDLIISAAAYTAVDQAESNEETARRVNALGPRALAESATSRNIPIVHLSTDYVFDGTKSAPYVESDPVGPVSAYGRTKLEGERYLLETTHNVVILRTAWVYSPFGKNFAKTMLRVGETCDALNIVADQIGNPTSALDIADGVLKVACNLIESSAPHLRGVFHMSGQGDASWADFAAEIFRISAANGGPTAGVGHISTVDYPTPAKRPANSRLNSGALRTTHGVQLPPWQDSTQNMIKRLVATRSYL